jgi:putative hemolysin
MPDVDVLLSRIARANGFAAAMIDTAMRKRFELMVGELQRELDAIEERPVSQRDSDKRCLPKCARGKLT